MLARRFTIVCLLITLFASLFSMLVAKASRPPHSWDIGIVVPAPSSTASSVPFPAASTQ